MAIYHFSAQVISRSKGQSAVAAAAYRSGERLKDERTNETKFYKREIKPETMILAPPHTPEWVQDRQQLWNKVEKIEKRKDAQLAREINIALPRELSKQEQTALIRNYVQQEFVDRGMIADVAIHRDNKENPHAHVMLTTRNITPDGFDKKNRDWNNKELLQQWREQWATHTNQFLEREGITDRISHESHEKRNLIIFPTIHLGYVAHEMEKRGVESNRGNINRDRQEYNRLVVDLQKYREEKKVLEQEIARKQEQKQNKERFYTAAERVHLQEAAKLLQAEPTLPNITEKQKELTHLEDRINHLDQKNRWKYNDIQEIANHYNWIHTFEDQIQQTQQRMDQINWLHPLKIKENRLTKEKAMQDIAHAKEQIQFHTQKLNDRRTQFEFHTEKEFQHIQHRYETDYPKLLEKNRQIREHIHQERQVLEKAETAHRNALVRQVASSYPERPEMRYISPETALKIHELQTLNQNQFVPMETIEKTFHIGHAEIQRLQGEINRIHQYQSRLQRAEEHLNKYEQYHTHVQKIEDNPFLKGKILMSKSAKQNYTNKVLTRDSYLSGMKREGISSRIDFEKQVERSIKMEMQLPSINNQIQSQRSEIRLLENIMNGLEEARKNMQIYQQYQDRQQSKTKRTKQKQWEVEK